MIPLLLLLQAAPAAPAPWAVTSKTDAASGVQSTMAGQLSADGNAKLVLRCDVSTVKVVSVQLFTKIELGGVPRPVIVTADAAAPLSASWDFRPKAAVVSADDLVTPLAAAIAGAQTIKVRTTTVAGEAVDLTFTGPGSNPALSQVLSACDYKLGELPVRAPATPSVPGKADK